MEKQRTYIAIDLKSFYASVECVAQGYDPLNVNLVVADPSRTEKTICLAVSPSLKEYGIKGRARLFEVVERIKELNRERRKKAPNHTFVAKSVNFLQLECCPEYEIDYIVAPPRMATYMQVSSKIYQIYLKYVSSEDIHAYSIDEVFIDATDYLPLYKKTARELAMTMILDVLNETGITATAGIGPNLYLCKVAMDVNAKHVYPDENGVRIAELDETSYRTTLWDHRPLTDFWRVGRGYASKLEEHGIYTMGDIARCSLGGPNDYYNEDLLYKLFGINAELLIDHAWGYEPCRISDIKSYKPQTNSISSGQVFRCAYPFDKAKLVMREMADALALDLVKKGLVTDQIVLNVGYDMKSAKSYKGELKSDRYGRAIPKDAHGSKNLPRQTSSSKFISDATMKLFDRIVDPALFVRRMNVTAAHVVPESEIRETKYEQLDLFTDYTAKEQERQREETFLAKEHKRQKAVLEIKDKYGKNAILKGINFEEGATAIERNGQVGGHKA